MMLPPGEYDVYWKLGYGHPSILLSSNVGVQSGQLSSIAVDAGIRLNKASWVPEFLDLYGSWWAVPAGADFDKTVDFTQGDVMLLPPGAYDVYWKLGYGHPSILLSSNVGVQPGQSAAVTADLGLEVHSALWVPEFLDLYGSWWAVRAGADSDKTVDFTQGDVMMLPPGQYDVYRKLGYGHPSILLSSNVGVSN